MTFKLNDSEFEQQRSAMAPVLLSLADELDAANSLRVGAMDSASRAEEIAAQLRAVLQSVSARLRELALPSSI